MAELESDLNPQNEGQVVVWEQGESSDEGRGKEGATGSGEGPNQEGAGKEELLISDLLFDANGKMDTTNTT